MQDNYEIPPIPDFLGAVMRLSNEAHASEPILDEDGTYTRPFLPLRGMVIYPQMVTPLFVGRDKSLTAVQAAENNSETLIVAAQIDSDVNDPAIGDLYSVGTEINIGRTMRLPDNNNSVLCQGRQRVEIIEFVQTEPYLRVRIRPLPEIDLPHPDTEALMRAVVDMFEQAVELDHKMPEEALTFAMNADQPGWLADFIASALDLPLHVKQSLLETANVQERLERISILLAQEVDMLEAESRIHFRVQQEIDKTQREHFLREQMRAIQGELGENDLFTQELNELRETIEHLQLPDEVRQKIEKEMARLATMPPMSPEIGVARSYLDWLIELPWMALSQDNLDVRHAAKVLDEDHYGLEKVKDRILEFIAVKRMAGERMKTPILCFSGPPGVGKTSLGRSIARALNREFVRMSLGGVRDEAEIRGHRRTYIGALPGRVIQAMRKVGTRNPIMMLDEIDKIGQDFRGDPSAALLEVLDPEQNFSFRDHYIEVDFDLSKVLFITTANSLEAIPHALRDRMEVIEFSSYLEEEKVAIAHQFIIPRQLEQHGMVEKRLQFDDDSLKMLIRRYTYEAGVRNLEREIANVCRKVARKLAEKRTVGRKVTSALLEELLGPPIFPEEMLRKEDEVGIATGVAWTPVGGDTLPIEVNLMTGKGSLLLTGKLGDVMKESAQAALTYTRSQAERLGIDPNRFEKTDIHLHVPEGAVPKDGPSAGVPLTIALISAFTNRPIRRDIGMTGEITLRGRVLPVGGIREKALAARRMGIKVFVMPKRNHTDLHNIPKRLREDMEFVEIEHIDEIFDLVLLPALPDLGANRGAA